MAEEKYTIYDIGFNKLLSRETPLMLEGTGLGLASSESSVFSGGSPTSLASGELIGNLTIKDGYIQSGNYVEGVSGWKLTPTTAQLPDLTIVGGTIRYGKANFDDSENAGYYIGSEGWYVGAASDVNYLKYNIGDGTFTLLSPTITSPKITDIQAGSELAIQGWQFSGTFSATNYRVVAWTSGTIKLMDGTTFAITGGNTGNMAAITYIYFSKATSETTLQTTTTASTAVGSNKILIAVAQNNSDTTSKATFQVFGGSGGQLLTVDNIAANSASTNEFISNTAQIKNAIITDAKIANLAVSKLTTGTMTSKQIQLAVADGTGDSYIAGGNNLDLANWRGGDANGGAFILGLDDSVAQNPAKLFLGNYSTSKYLQYDGENVTLVGGIISGAKVPNTTLGTIPLASAPNEVWTQSTSYRAVKEIRIGISGWVSMRWNTKTSDASSKAYSRIYLNGQYYGEGYSESTSYSEAGVDMSVSAGDFVRLEIKSENASYACYVNNFRVCVATPPLPFTVTTLDTAGLVS